MTFHVDSEVGTLRQAIVHRPGLELDRLTPQNVDDLLFDDVMWAQRSREEHDAFVEKLRDKGVVVHLFHQLLTEALDEPGAREFLQDKFTTATRFGPMLERKLDELVASAPADRLAEALVGGVLRSDLDLDAASSLLWTYLAPGDFLLPPLPNHLFQRDNSAWVYDGLSVNPMSKQARKRETFNSRTVWNFHPLFRDAGLHFYYGNDDEQHDPANVEGGDILVVGNGTVMIGMGERTTPQGIEFLARRYFAHGSVTRVIVVELPKTRVFMHLDTAMTMIDKDAFSVYPYLSHDLRCFELLPSGSGGDYVVREFDELWPLLADAVGVDKMRVLQTPIDEMGAAR